MKTAKPFLPVLLILLACSTTEEQVIPEARPVHRLFRAVIDGDPRLLETVWSERMHASMAAQGWQAVLDSYRKGLEMTYGEFAPGDFSYRYFGGPDEGKVTVLREGVEQGDLMVVRQNGEWKLDER